MTDEERANEIIAKLKSALAVVNGIIDVAKEQGLFVTYKIGEDAITNKRKITEITIAKKV